MPSGVTTVFAAGAISFALIAGSASAGLLEFTASGVVADFDGLGIGPWSGVTVDDAWSLSAVIDMGAEDENPNSSISRFRPETLQLSIAGITDDMWTDRRIGVFATSSLHSFFIIGEYADGDTGAIWRVSLGLEDTTESTFESDALPSSLAIGDFNVTSFSLERITELFTGDPGEPFELNGTVESIGVATVPAPGALSLVGLAMVTTLSIRTRRRPA